MPEHPTGTVTFLFTDIEGSTRRWDQQSEAMKTALARHDTILRAAIEAHDGQVFKTVGDAFYAAFPTAPDALASALEAQRALMAETWGGIGEMRVRMALHTGAAQQRDGDYFGQPLNRVARLLAAGHGGQTLLSLATQELVRDELREGVQLRDLGTHRLRDLIRPEQIFQVVAPPLPAYFPPLKTLDARRHNLPVQPTPLIGREHEVGQVCAQLRREDVRLITLTGPGGTGKTRLALQVAADLLDDYKDGIYFVELAPLSDANLVGSTVAQTLSVKETGGRSLTQALLDYLREKTVLLALDNFEQVIAAAPQIAELLAGCPRLKVIVTSRIPLHVRGEHEFPVPSLALPNIRQLPPLEALSQYAAVELFIQRAQAVKPGFAVNNENAPAVAEICVRLDGLPLAIELAAARIKLLAPQAMLGRLEDPLKFLTGGARDLSARQQTLRGAIAWSYDLLDENEKRLFRRLAAFAGGCTLEAAEAVCYTEGDLRVDAFDCLASLVDKSLLRQQDTVAGEPRFFMLETIREYAADRLTESGDRKVIDARHLNYFLEFAERIEPELEGPQGTMWLDRLELELGNLRVALECSLAEDGNGEDALRLAAALGEFWSDREHFREGRRWLERALEKSSSAAESIRAKALERTGSLVMHLGDYASARSLLEESLQIYRKLEDRHGVANVLFELSIVIVRHQGVGAARALAEQCLTLRRELGDKVGIARALGLFGNVILHEGDLTFALCICEEALALCRELGMVRERLRGKVGIDRALDNVAVVVYNQGNLQRGRSHFEESLFLRRKAGNRRLIGYSLQRLGELVTDQGDYPRARALYDEGLAIYRELGIKLGAAKILEKLAILNAVQGDYSASRARFEESLTVLGELSDRHGMGNLFLEMAAVAADEGDCARARAHYEQSLALAREMDHKWITALALCGLGKMVAEQGEYARGRSLIEEGLAIFRALGTRRGYRGVLSTLGRVARRQGDYALARTCHEQSMAMYRDTGASWGVAMESGKLGLVARLEGDHGRAATLFREGLTMWRQIGNPRNIAKCLEGIAGLAGAQGHSERAARLFGAAQALREAIGAPLKPARRAEHERDVAAVRGGLPESAFAAAWAEGRTMTMEQAVTYALLQD